MTNPKSGTLLNVQNLNVDVMEEGYCHRYSVRLLDNLSFSLNSGQCLAVLGESGSGKSTLCKALLGLCHENFHVSGQVVFNQQNLLKLPYHHQNWTLIRGKKIGFIPQNCTNAFNPLLTVGYQINEILNQHFVLKKFAKHRLIRSAFCAVALPNYGELFQKYAYQLSGGTLQRVAIALAIMLKPDIIIADEPTSNIDWISKREVLTLFKQVLSRYHIALIMITHDFSDINHLADEIIILKAGKVVEQGLLDKVLYQSSEVYTKSLLSIYKKFNDHFYRLLNEDEADVNG